MATGNKSLGRFDLSDIRSEEHTSELQSHRDLVCRLLREKKKREQGLLRRMKTARARNRGTDTEDGVAMKA